MRIRAGWLPSSLLAWLLALGAACTADRPRAAPVPAPPVPASPVPTSPVPASPTATGSTATSTTAPIPTATGTPGSTASPVPTPSPGPNAADLWAQRLRIPALGIDAPVQGSQVIPDTSTPPPGCPAPPPGQTTFTVPNQGVATPTEPIEGLEQKTWIFGHSRWQGSPGLLLGLVDLDPGDEVFVDGVDRATAKRTTGRRFVVDDLYLTDIESGGTLVNAETPAAPLVILQTSVREDGAGKQWILDRQRVLAKSQNLVQGSLDDPCKYLLLFVFARAS